MTLISTPGIVQIRRLRRIALGLVLGLGIALPAAPARADVTAAARAFSDGQAAQLEGNYERAAQSFELAFHIAASKEALRSAVRARQLANQLPRAATLAELLLAQYGDDATSEKLATDVIAEARSRLGRLTVKCQPRCTVVIGGRAISIDSAPSHVVFTAPGHQVLEVTFDGDRTTQRELTVHAGDDVTVPVEPPPAKRVPRPRDAPAPARARDGLSPRWTIGGTAATITLAGFATWSGIDTQRAHDAYVKAPTQAGWDDGRSKQLRTNILLGTTAAAGLATVLIAVLWTRWDDHPAPKDVAVVPVAGGGAALSFGGAF